MRRIAWLAGTLLGALALPQAAGASGDFGCDPAWRLFNREFNRCSNTALLSPGNDTRVNLLFLVRDRQAAPATRFAYPGENLAEPGLGHNFFSWRMLRGAFYPQAEAEDPEAPYGSRCISLASGTKAFTAAMQANRGLPAGERDKLAAARGTVAKTCGEASAGSLVAPADIASAPGREYLGYLQAADAFYAEQWDAARDGFTRLRASKDSWLAETAAYMVARTELNAAQNAAFDEYGSFDAGKVDKAAVGRARGGFTDYLKRYAQGRYAASASGLVRRTLWLGGDAVGLAREYERLLAATSPTTAAAADLVQEVDNKLLTNEGGRAIDGPLLLATVDLMMMREPYDNGPQPIALAQIVAQEKSFAGRADLYGYVLASHAFYVEKNPAKVLQLLPDDARQPAYAPLAFSRQVLRGMALAAKADRNEAGFWRELLGGANGPYQRPIVELALAMNLERSGRLADVFAPMSPIGETAIREILLQNVAGADLLRSQARDAKRPVHERDLALFTLLHKQLAYGNYAGFVSDSAMLGASASNEGGLWDLLVQDRVPAGLFRKATWSDGYACPALSATAATLTQDPRDVKARLCLGDFYRLNGFDDFGVFADDAMRPKRDELGGTPTLFAGKPTPRGDFYAQIIADPKAGGEDKAYALFRAINCYAPSGSNACGNADVPESQRRTWFQRLKKDHGASPWAQKLRYYW
ncbi:hypothetical protein WG901_19280 [Novosphingobium sp. PS1R-30]|uniref:Outer membrane assembly lipoprotein YfiO n=1 Tax=Novosphingobium anseongense TaxID=3133436 RepID=A0ABU8S0F7_9SPHN